MKNPEQSSESQESSELREASSAIIEAMKNYEPIDFPREGQEARFIGSNVPSSFFMYGERKILVKTLYDFESRELSVIAVDEQGGELRDVVDEYDVWSWHVKGRKEVEEEYQKLAQREAKCGSSGTTEEKAFSVFRKEDVPPDSVEKYKIERWKKQDKQTTLNLRAEIDDNGVPKPGICNINNLGEDMFNFSDEKFQDILKQVAGNMVAYAENPELRITLEELEDKLKPGGESRTGFLADNEKLFDIINRDTETLRKHGVTFRDIAEKVAQLFDAVGEGSKEVVIGSSHFEVMRKQTRGVQFCPWGVLDRWHTQKTGSPETKKYEQFGYVGEQYKCDGSADYEIKNLKTGHTVHLPSMAPHLIGDHHFFEGNTGYRMDPQVLIEVLEIKKKTKSGKRSK